MVSTADLQARLAALDAAILEIATGKQVVLARVDDKTVQYGPGSLTQLRQLRDELNNQLVTCSGNRRRVIYLTPG